MSSRRPTTVLHPEHPEMSNTVGCLGQRPVMPGAVVYKSSIERRWVHFSGSKLGVGGSCVRPEVPDALFLATSGSS